MNIWPVPWVPIEWSLTTFKELLSRRSRWRLADCPSLLTLFIFETTYLIAISFPRLSLDCIAFVKSFSISFEPRLHICSIRFSTSTSILRCVGICTVFQRRSFKPRSWMPMGLRKASFPLVVLKISSSCLIDLRRSLVAKSFSLEDSSHSGTYWLTGIASILSAMLSETISALSKPHSEPQASKRSRSIRNSSVECPCMRASKPVLIVFHSAFCPTTNRSAVTSLALGLLSGSILSILSTEDNMLRWASEALKQSLSSHSRTLSLAAPLTWNWVLTQRGTTWCLLMLWNCSIP